MIIICVLVCEFITCIVGWIEPWINNTARWEKGGGRRVFSQIEPSFPLPYSTVPVPLLRDARPTGWVNCFSICANTMPSPNQDSIIRFNSQERRNTLPIWVYNLSMDRTQKIGISFSG